MAYVSKKHKLMDFFFQMTIIVKLWPMKFMMFDFIILFLHKILVFLFRACLFQP
jgi:hypothetical protein